MKKRIPYISFLLTLFVGFSFCAYSQGCFWLETWSGTACPKGCTTYTGPNGAWTVNTGVGPNGSSANIWYFSTQEKGQGRTVCGAAGAPATAHIGNVSTSPAAFLFCPAGDCGAAYDAGIGDGEVLTNTRLESPVINCTGQNTITLSFNYIMTGQSLTTDFTNVWYFNGVVWALLASPPKATKCGAQGKWAFYSVALPASANNNPNVKIGFWWQNNDDGIGNDPSFAVDSVCLSVPVLLPVGLLDFSAKYNNNENAVDLNWSTATETNNSFFTIEKTKDGEEYSTVTTVKGAGNSSITKYYSAIDPSPYEGTSYYRLKQTDYDGHFTYSNPVEVNVVNTNKIKLFPNPAGSSLNISYYSSSANVSSTMYIYDNAGRTLSSHIIASSYAGMNTYQFDISGLASGMYIVKIETATGQAIFNKFIKQ